MSLYKEVINLKVDENLAVMTDTGMVHCTYATGFVDALTQVAPITLKAEARIEELEVALEWILSSFKNVLAGKSVRDADESICHIEKLLENK